MKDKALQHVRSVCDELKEGDVVDLRHWLRGINVSESAIKLLTNYEGHTLHMTSVIAGELDYNLTKDGENQNPEFYQAYCEITNCV